MDALIELTGKVLFGKAFYLTVLLSILFLKISAQDASDYTIGIQADLVKTDNTKLFDKAQLGAEVNYFVTEEFTATAGFEVWTAEEFSFVIGGRWFPVQEAFLRLRGLIGENDISLGGGWVKPVKDNLRFEAMGDFYFSVDFSIRIGLIYVIKKD